MHYEETEDFRNQMTRKPFAFAILMLLLFMLLSGAAGAEEPVPATPTDLECAHEHTKTTIYFFDSPVYVTINAESHRVTGPATIETVCLDCDEVLASETVDNAEEIRPHSMKRGVCALCEQASISTALVRGETGTAAVAIGVPEMLGQTEQAGADLYLQLAEREDGSFFAGLYLISGSETRTEPEDEGITLRFYRQTRSDVRVSLAPADEDTLIETEGVWNDKGYWSVPYLEEGTYFLLQ